MNSYALYDKTTGQLLGLSNSNSNTLTISTEKTVEYIQVPKFDMSIVKDYYVKEEVLTERPSITEPTVTSLSLTFSFVPEGTTLLVDKQDYGSVSGEVTIDLPFPNIWELELLTPFPFKPWKKELNLS
jgi:hypothetical protein